MPRRPAPDQRLPKDERLRKRPEFLAVQGRGRKIHLKHLLVFVLPRSPAVGRRVGITTTRKVGDAVARNRIRRLVREAWRREREALPEGHDYVFVAKRSAVEMTFAELREELRRLGRRLRR